MENLLDRIIEKTKETRSLGSGMLDIVRNSAIERIIDIVREEFAKETPQTWIPAKNPPKQSGWYLVTYHHEYNDGDYHQEDTYVKRMRFQEDKGWMYPFNVDEMMEKNSHREVLAWQELPECYQESAKEQDLEDIELE